MTLSNLQLHTYNSGHTRLITLFFISLLVSTFVFVVIPFGQIVKAQTSGTTISLDPLSFNATQQGQAFSEDIKINNVQNLWGWVMNVSWDSRYVTFTGASEGSFLKNQVDSDLFLYSTNPYNFSDPYYHSDSFQGIEIQAACTSSNDTMDQSASGSGVLATLQFQATRQTTSTPVTIEVEQLLGPNPVSVQTGADHPIITPVSPQSTAIISIIIPGPPTANAGRDETIVQGAQAVFNASQSVSSGTNTNYTWTFTDGTPKNLTGIIANYTFNNPGTFNVTLTVQDSIGNSSCVHVVTVIPSADASPSPTPDTTTAPTSSSNPSTTPIETASPTSSPSNNPNQNGSTSLPPEVLAIVVILTILVLGGSFFWLRKST